MSAPDVDYLVSGLALTRQVFTLSTLRARTRAGAGVFVISGQTAPVMHAGGCRWVTEENFARKVIHSQGRGGRYWWFPDATAAQTSLGDMALCAHCITADVAQHPARRRTAGSPMSFGQNGSPKEETPCG